MPRARTVLVFALTILGLVAAFPNPGEAKKPRVLHTAIAANPLPTAQFIIAADNRQKPTQEQELQFPMQSLPKDKDALTSCAVRLVMAERYPKDTNNESQFDPVVLGLFQFPAQDPEAQPVAAWAVPPKTEKSTAVVLRSKSLCQALTPGQAEPARFLLRTTVREGRLVLFGQSDNDNPSDRPKLLLTYNLPNGTPGEADWGQLRHDVQHSGRSGWRVYDPDGKYAPTQFSVVALNAPDGVSDSGNLRQSPLLYGGEIFNAPDLEGHTYELTARDRSGQVLSKVTVDDNLPIRQPKFIVAGGRDRLYYFSENRIVGYSLASGALVRAPEPPIPNAGTLLTTSTPTVGADGSLYFATDNNVQAYSPGPEQKLLWRYQYPTQEHQVGAVALSNDETTAYILLGGTDTRLVALDAATGDCRWQQQGFAIDRKENSTGTMPIPVVAGNDIFVTDSYRTVTEWTGDHLYVFHDEAQPTTPAGGGLVSPAPPRPACRADKAPGGMEVRGGEGNHIPAAVAGPGDEAYYIRDGKLCRSLKEEDCKAVQCSGGKDLKGITLLIGDNSAGNSFHHLYGLDGVKKELFYISFGEWPQALKCDAYQPGANVGPNLILAPGGTLYNVGNDSRIRAIVPTALADSQKKETLTLDEKFLRDNSDSTIRVSGTIKTADNLPLPSDTNLILVAGESISFGNGLKVEQGAQLRARVGLGQ